MNAELQDPEQPRKLSFPFAKRHGVLVRGVSDGTADTVCRPGVTPQSLAEVRRFVGVPLKLQRVSVEAFDSMLRIAYEAGSGAAMQMLEGLDDNTDLAHLAEDIPESSDLLESDDEAPIIRLINALLTQAVKENASDIHIEPYENRLVIRFRVDGVLREVLQTKRAVAPLVVSRIKVMSKLDIAERRLPQDGRISLRIAGRRPHRLIAVEVTRRGVSYGTPHGSATLVYSGSRHTLTVTVHARGVAPGPHAAHIHLGSCMSQGPVLYMLKDLVANRRGVIVHAVRVFTGVTTPIPARGWYLNIHQGNSRDILSNGQPTIFFRPLLCSNIK
jgi:hypothetical protein